MTTTETVKPHIAQVRLEHVNINVTDPKRTASLLSRLFDWQIRWEGPSIGQGYTIHVGSEADYLALYSNSNFQGKGLKASKAHLGLNHIAVEVDDLDAIETRVRAEGLTPYSFSDYEPGRRFYFNDLDNIEYEVVSYARASAPL